MIVRQKLAKLLDRPTSRGMLRDVDVQNPPRTDFHRNEYIRDPERRRHGHEKVASEDACARLRTRVVHSCPESPARIALQILADGSRRHASAQLQRELACDPLLTARWVFASHRDDQLSQVSR